MHILFFYDFVMILLWLILWFRYDFDMILIWLNFQALQVSREPCVCSPPPLEWASASVRCKVALWSFWVHRAESDKTSVGAYFLQCATQVRETNLLVDFITVLKGIAGSAKGRTHASISSTGTVTGCIVQNVWRVKQMEHDNMSDQAQHRK